MLQHWRQVKAQHKDAILFYRIGDFYDMKFGRRCILVAQMGQKRERTAGQPNRVRLNEEVCGVFTLNLPEGQGLVPGQTLTLPELFKHQIRDMALTMAEANCGHFTLVFLGTGYFLTFDFRYNAGRIEQLLVRAEEFLEAATSALRRKRYSAFVENLFAAVELLAKATLMIHPDERVLTNKKHDFVRTEINRYRKHGNIPAPFTRLLNRLTELRPSARYSDAPFLVDHDVARRMSWTARRFFKHVDQIRPRRHASQEKSAA
jgi:HEPN domain-containing protein